MSEILGEIIKSERKAQEISQQELANLAGVGLNFVSQAERGKATLRLDKLLSLLNVLGLELQLKRGTRGVTVSKELV